MDVTDFTDKIQQAEGDGGNEVVVCDKRGTPYEVNDVYYDEELGKIVVEFR